MSTSKLKKSILILGASLAVVPIRTRNPNDDSILFVEDSKTDGWYRKFDKQSKKRNLK